MYIYSTVHTQGWAPEAAAKKKTRKYAELGNSHLFVPIAFESMGALCSEGQDLVTAIGARISQASGDPREFDFLRQILPAAIQQGNAACVLSSTKLYINSEFS